MGCMYSRIIMVNTLEAAVGTEKEVKDRGVSIQTLIQPNE